MNWNKLPDRRVPREPIPLIAPDLVVEVISKGNTGREMERKLSEYFEAGVRLVWYVYPNTSTARAFTSVEKYQELTITDSLDGGDVLPGFRLALSRLFDESKK